MNFDSTRGMAEVNDSPINVQQATERQSVRAFVRVLALMIGLTVAWPMFWLGWSAWRAYVGEPTLLLWGNFCQNGVGRYTFEAMGDLGTTPHVTVAGRVFGFGDVIGQPAVTIIDARTDWRIPRLSDDKYFRAIDAAQAMWTDMEMFGRDPRVNPHYWSDMSRQDGRFLRCQIHWPRLWGHATESIAFGLLATAAVVLGKKWWLRRRSVSRRAAIRCVKCGYDMGGLPAGAVCPECKALPGLS